MSRPKGGQQEVEQNDDKSEGERNIAEPTSLGADAHEEHCHNKSAIGGGIFRPMGVEVVEGSLEAWAVHGGKYTVFSIQ